MGSLTTLLFTGVFAAVFLTACGGGGSNSSVNSDNTGSVQTSFENIEIVGAGIKGPLAFADAKIFVADPSFPDFYDKNAPLSSVITNQYAQTSGLSVPANIKPPFILTIGGKQAIDLNTGKPPVISTLVTVITADMLAGRKPVYATPLTTLVFHMARHAASATKSTDAFLLELERATPEVGNLFGVNTDKVFNVLSSPLTINSSTDTAEKQEQAVYHRVAIEAFAAKVYELSKAKGNGLLANYFNDTTFSSMALQRIDPTVNFSWQGGSPANNVNKNNFSVRWTGLVAAKYSEQYTFYTSTDDGVRLWVDGQLLIDNWTDQSEQEHAGVINLTAGKKYPIVMEYYDNLRSAAAKLYWSSTSQSKSIIAKESLYSVSDPALVADLTPGVIIDHLALDLQSDGIIDNSAKGIMIGGIDPAVLERAPANLMIPNTSSRVSDIITVMENERVLLGTDTGPILQVKTVDFANAPVFRKNNTISGSNQGTSGSSNNDTGTGTGTGTATGDATSGTTNDNPTPEIFEPVIALSTSEVNFPQQLVGEISGTRKVTVANSGNAALTISAITISAGFLETNDCNNYLPAGTSCTVNIRFVPTTANIAIGELKISGNVASTPYIVKLTGSVSSSAPTSNITSDPGTSSPCANLETIFCIDHDEVAIGHHVTDADITQWFLADQNRAGITNDVTGGAIDIVADPGGDTTRGNVMRIFNSEGAHGFTDGINGPSSGQWRSWPGAHKELYFAFDFYMEPNRMWTMGQKLPGLLGGSWSVASGGTQGGLPDGTNGFSARAMMFSNQSYPGKGNGSIAQYTYYTDHAQRPMWYDNRPEGQITLKRGRWYTLESYIKVNTPGVANGIMRAWVDGVQVLEKTNVMWRTVDTLKLDGVFFTFGYGGGSDIWNSPEDQYNYFDNWVLSTKPITH